MEKTWETRKSASPISRSSTQSRKGITRQRVKNRFQNCSKREGENTVYEDSNRGMYEEFSDTSRVDQE